MAAPELPLFLQVFPEYEDIYNKAQQRAAQFAEYTLNTTMKTKGDSIEGEYVPLLLEINKLGCITLDSQSGVCTNTENPVYITGEKKGNPIVRDDGVRMTLLREQQRAYLEGLLPKKLFYPVAEKIKKKYGGQFGIVKLGERGTTLQGKDIPLTTYYIEYEDGEIEKGVHSIVPDYSDIDSEYKYINIVLQSAGYSSYGGGVKGLQINEDWIKFNIHSMLFCLKANEEDGLFTVFLHELKEVLEEMIGAAVTGAAAGGGGSTSGGRRNQSKRRQQKLKAKKLSRRRRTKAKSQI
jgi:hypothetical protein